MSPTFSRKIPKTHTTSRLTARQWRVLKAIQRHVTAHGYPPTRSEICALMGFKSPNAAEDHLRALARKGAIKMVPHKARGIKLVGWLA